MLFWHYINKTYETHVSVNCFYESRNINVIVFVPKSFILTTHAFDN